MQTNFINWPKPPIDSMSSKSLTNQINTSILCLEGIPYSTCNFVLSPSKTKEVSSFKIESLDRTANILTHRAEINIKKTFSDWQLLDPYNRLRSEVKNYMEDHKNYLISKGFELDVKNNLVNGLLVYTDFLHLLDLPSAFKIQYDLEEYSGNIIWRIMEKDPMKVEGRTCLIRHTHKSHDNTHICLDFKPKKNKVYALSAELVKHKSNANIKIKTLLVWVRCDTEKN